jgi:hypothetical protein
MIASFTNSLPHLFDEDHAACTAESLNAMVGCRALAGVLIREQNETNCKQPLRCALHRCVMCNWHFFETISLGDLIISDVRYTNTAHHRPRSCSQPSVAERRVRSCEGGA